MVTDKCHLLQRVSVCRFPAAILRGRLIASAHSATSLAHALVDTQS